MTLNELITRIQPLDEAAMEAARRRQDALAKPPRSLGRLEDLSIQLAGITGKVQNTMDKTHLLVFAADNGVVEEGVSSAPQSVTLMQTVNLTRAKPAPPCCVSTLGPGSPSVMWVSTPSFGNRRCWTGKLPLGPRTLPRVRP